MARKASFPDPLNVSVRSEDTKSDANVNEEEWKTVWRLCSFSKQNLEVDFVSLTRFEDTTQSIANLTPGKYMLYLYMFKGKDLTSQSSSPQHQEEIERQNSSPKPFFRSVLQAATFGTLGKREVQVDWKLFNWTERRSSLSTKPFFSESVTLSLEETPATSIVFTVGENQTNASALLSFSSSSTLNALNVAAQLYKQRETPQPSPTTRQRRVSSTTVATQHRGEDSRTLALCSSFVGCVLGFSSYSAIQLGVILLALFGIAFACDQIQYAALRKPKAD